MPTPLIYPRFQHFGPEEGLTKTRIRTIIQDRQGYLWIGTLDGGLVRYDGYTFRSFRHSPGDSTSLSSSAVEAVFEDSRGWLWIGTSDGLNRFEQATERSYRIPLFPNTSSNQTKTAITSICEDTTGSLWIGTTKGVLCLSVLGTLSSDGPVPMQVIHIPPVPDNPKSLRNKIKVIEIDRTGTIWVGTQQGLGLILPNVIEQDSTADAPTQFRFHSFLPEVGSASTLETDDINAITEDRQGQIWILAETLYQIDPSRNSLKSPVRSFDTPSGPYNEEWYAILDMTRGKDSFFWIGGLRFLVNFDVSKQAFTQIAVDANDLNHPTRFGISALLRDQSGIVWVGTSWGGLYKYDPLAQFSQYHPALQQIKQNTSTNLRFVCEDSHGDLWLVTDKVYHCDRRNGQTKLVIEKKDLPVPAYYVNHILEDDAKNIWLATENRGFFRLDPGSQRIVDHFPDKGFEWFSKTGEQSTVNVIELAQDRAGTIWAPAEVNEINQESRSVLFEFNLSVSQLKIHPLPSWDGTPGIVEFYDLQPTGNGTIWLATQNGLVRFDKQSGQFQKFQHDSRDSTSLSHDRVKSICPDPFQPQRYLWLGTEDGGLNLFDIEKETFRHYTVMNGLPSNHISSILNDEAGHLWLATDNGLSKITLDNESHDIKSIRNYDRRDGLYGNDFTYYYGQNAAKTARGELIFTGPKGFNIFHPDNIKQNLKAPEVLISDLQINYAPVSVDDADSPLQRQIHQTKKIELPYDRNTLTFEMTALDFRVPSKNRYAYKMEGYDREWVDSGTDRTAHYTGLPWGDYVFNVRATNSDGVWNEQGTVLEITITPPWWRTKLAYVIYAICLLGILYAARRFEASRQRFKYQADLERMETEKLKELDKLKSDFFANISHEFRTPLTLILGPVEQLLEEAAEGGRKRLVLIRRNAQRLLRLINELLDLSKLESGRMQLQASPGDFVAFLKRVVMSFESWARDKGIDLGLQVHTCEASEPSQGLTEAYFDCGKMEKIFFNLLSNALKFTPEGGTVSVACQLPNSDLIESEIQSLSSQAPIRVTVSDTGPGIPADRLPKVFDRFSQAETSTSRAYEGTGIGLALVKELVELHHGTIAVTSEEGRGTTFTICLPLGKEHLTPDEIFAVAHGHAPLERTAGAVSQEDVETHNSVPEPKESPNVTNGDQPIILIIEDNSDVRAYIREQLKTEYTVLEASDGEAGIEQAVEAIPDLVISDVMMPKKDGFEVCRILKTDERTSHIPVILLTAKAQEKAKLDGLET
ncbi:ATP-binding protein, partial [bacterium]|nr:ATP-binding protein [bacterium]